MKTKTEKVLTVMHVLAWITFIGLSIKAGALIFSAVISTINPPAAKNLYDEWNLYTLFQYSNWHYLATVSLMAAVIVMEAHIAMLVIKVLSKIKISSPFTIDISKRLESISYYIFATWVVAIIYNAHIKWLSKKVDGLLENELSIEFILLAGVVYIFSQIFKKGVEYQRESELTV